MKKTNTEHFGIQRKIVANMTSESWRNIPHVTYMYEHDASGLMREYRRLNLGRTPEEKITLNTLTLRLICEGLKAAPGMNAHIEYDKKLVRGKIDTYENIDISLPMMLPDGGMMTVNLHDFDKKSVEEMRDYIADVRRRMENTNMEEAMFDVSLTDTLRGIKKGKILNALYRLIGSKTGKHRIKGMSMKEKKEYLKIPASERLAAHDIEQGTVTVSNIGSVYPGQTGVTSLLEIVPPQVCAIAVGAVQDRALVVSDGDGYKSVEARPVLPLCIAFDHRALDFGDVVPFIKRLDEIFDNPEIIRSWSNKKNDGNRGILSAEV